MKRLLTISIFLIALCISHPAIAQSFTFDLKRSINLTSNDKDDQSIILNVTEKTSSLGLDINCKVLLGSLKIEIYNPKGEKQGEFAVESQLKEKLPLNYDESLNRELVEGKIEKIISDPIAGKWIIKLIPTKTYASIKINSRFITHN